MPVPESIILVVEDETLVRMLAVDVLRDAGHTVLEAADGIEALEILESSGTDLLITDAEMPRMNGYQLVEAAMTRWPGLKILLITGYTKECVPANIVRALSHTLQKPFDIERLPGLVAELLGSPSA